MDRGAHTTVLATQVHSHVLSHFLRRLALRTPRPQERFGDVDDLRGMIFDTMTLKTIESYLHIIFKTLL